ncbi:hypothetical protein HMPREF1545_00605 [Oscillibacter sp. KLE 1728]|nr:hypothetical protein HMPREF1545_00605 [Oscillibacter sp. KLE 1728]ERK66149.1 hypothetical protein HMPREF1546_01045 [Oscillibacter sp. KLE 1745]
MRGNGAIRQPVPCVKHSRLAPCCPERQRFSGFVKGHPVGK